MMKSVLSFSLFEKYTMFTSIAMERHLKVSENEVKILDQNFEI